MNASDVRNFLSERMSGVDVYYGFMPTDPINCAVVFGGAGGTVDLDMIGFDSWGIQVRVRGEDYNTAEGIAQQAYEALHGVTDAVIGAYVARTIFANQPPIFIGNNANQQAEFTVNFRFRAHKA